MRSFEEGVLRRLRMDVADVGSVGAHLRRLRLFHHDQLQLSAFLMAILTLDLQFIRAVIAGVHSVFWQVRLGVSVVHNLRYHSTSTFGNLNSNLLSGSLGSWLGGFLPVRACEVDFVGLQLDHLRWLVQNDGRTLLH